MDRKTWLPVCLVVVLSTLPGCRSTATPGPTVSSEWMAQDQASATHSSVTFFDRPEFQDGTGPVDSGTPPAFTETDSGLSYRVLRQSEGKKPGPTSTVTVNYRGWLSNGKVFDSSYERGDPTSFPLDGVIAGWTEGMQLVGEGGMIELWVPSHLGYGERGSPESIPPHSHLNFIVELVHVD